MLLSDQLQISCSRDRPSLRGFHELAGASQNSGKHVHLFLIKGCDEGYSGQPDGRDGSARCEKGSDPRALQRRATLGPRGRQLEALRTLRGLGCGGLVTQARPRHWSSVTGPVSRPAFLLRSRDGTESSSLLITAGPPATSSILGQDLTTAPLA